MKTIDVTTILGKKDRPWFELFQLKVSRQEFRNWIKTDPVVDWVDGLGDADYFAIEFDCGLQVAFEFLHGIPPSILPPGTVLATEWNAHHVRRHLSIWNAQLVEFADDVFFREREWAFKHFPQLLLDPANQSRWQLMRMGDDGNPMAIGQPTSKPDAECWQAEFESRGHKQTYWVDQLQRS
jgi:hypothetical protein